MLESDDEKRQYQLAWRVTVLEQALSQLGQGIVMLTTEGKIMFMTQEAEMMLAQQDGLSCRDDHLIALIPQDQERLQQALSSFDGQRGNKSYKSFYIHRFNQLRPYLLYVSAICLGGTQDAGIMVIVKDTQANMMHWVERLKSKYNLTNREAEITVLLTEGRSTHEICAVMEIAEDTTRQYLKNCFKKMGVQKQHELVCLALDSSRRR